LKIEFWRFSRAFHRTIWKNHSITGSKDTNGSPQIQRIIIFHSHQTWYFISGLLVRAHTENILDNICLTVGLTKSSIIQLDIFMPISRKYRHDPDSLTWFPPDSLSEAKSTKLCMWADAGSLASILGSVHSSLASHSVTPMVSERGFIPYQHRFLSETDQKSNCSLRWAQRNSNFRNRKSR
jgi:hypothetical protein